MTSSPHLIISLFHRRNLINLGQQQDIDPNRAEGGKVEEERKKTYLASLFQFRIIGISYPILPNELISRINHRHKFGLRYSCLSHTHPHTRSNDDRIQFLHRCLLLDSALFPVPIPIAFPFPPFPWNWIWVCWVCIHLIPRHHLLLLHFRKRLLLNHSSKSYLLVPGRY
jgi:hypothetical protein